MNTNATSVAGLLLTTEVMVAEAPKDEEYQHPMPDMGGTGDMGMKKGTLRLSRESPPCGASFFAPTYC